MSYKNWEWTGFSWDGLLNWFGEVTRGYGVDSAGKDQIDRTKENSDNPVFIDEVGKSDPFFGWLYDWYYDYRERQDRSRIDEDLYKNSGQTWKNSPYPWYSYRNNSYSGSFTGGTSGDLFEASTRVISMWSHKLDRW